MTRMTRSTRAVTRHLPALLWAVILAALLLAPGSELPTAGWGWIVGFHLGDKLLHALGFGIAAWLWHRSLEAPLPGPAAGSRLALAVWLAIVYGAGLEVAQSWWASGRDGEPWDAVANGAGAVAYAGLVLARRRSRASARGRIGAHESHRAPGERRAPAD